MRCMLYAAVAMAGGWSVAAMAQPSSPLGVRLPADGEPVVSLPAPLTAGGPAMSDVMATRRSTREFTGEPLTLAEVSQLLWATQGVTDEQGRRTVPSAGARYPLELYVVVDRVEGLDPGLYHYVVGEHALAPVRTDATGLQLNRATYGNRAFETCGLSVIAVGVVERVASKYGWERADLYVVLEGGAALQHLQLQATALGLGAVFIGGFDDAAVQAFVDTDTLPVGVVPVGRPRTP